MKVELVGYLRRIMSTDEIELKLDERVTLSRALMMLPEPLRGRIMEAGNRISAGIIILLNGVEVGGTNADNVYVGDEDRVVLIPVIHGGSTPGDRGIP